MTEEQIQNESQKLHEKIMRGYAETNKSLYRNNSVCLDAVASAIIEEWEALYGGTWEYIICESILGDSHLIFNQYISAPTEQSLARGRR